jgi:hypothetical protein
VLTSGAVIVAIPLVCSGTPQTPGAPSQAKPTRVDKGQRSDTSTLLLVVGHRSQCVRCQVAGTRVGRPLGALTASEALE